jgi:hypothetical protein
MSITLNIDWAGGTTKVTITLHPMVPLLLLAL